MLESSMLTLNSTTLVLQLSSEPIMLKEPSNAISHLTSIILVP